MPFRAGTPFLRGLCSVPGYERVAPVSMPSRAGTPFLRVCLLYLFTATGEVSMPFRADAPFLPELRKLGRKYDCDSINALLG